jgi:cytidine deaminase
MSEFDALIKAATLARENAHARFSNFKVGAALRTAEGEIFGGCNVENALTPPCGACRQLIWEFCGDVPVVMVNLKGKSEIFKMSELFPKPFDASNL